MDILDDIMKIVFFCLFLGDKQAHTDDLDTSLHVRPLSGQT